MKLLLLIALIFGVPTTLRTGAQGSTGVKAPSVEYPADSAFNRNDSIYLQYTVDKRLDSFRKPLLDSIRKNK